MPAIAYRKPSPGATHRLVCIPFAGGTARAYLDWIPRLSPRVDVCPIQLPGREGRMGEPLPTSVEAIVSEIDEAIATLPPLPVVLFGHSMGAMIAYEVAQRMAARGAAPHHLVVAGRVAPQCPLREERVSHLDDAAFTEKLRELGGTPEAVFDIPELLELLLPIVRADMRLFETYEHDPARPPLPTPVTALSGRDDPWVAIDDADAWRAVTDDRFRLELFDGGHFFLDEHREAIWTIVDDACR